MMMAYEIESNITHEPPKGFGNSRDVYCCSSGIRRRREVRATTHPHGCIDCRQGCPLLFDDFFGCCLVPYHNFDQVNPGWFVFK
jgi:hypothetical protein